MKNEMSAYRLRMTANSPVDNVVVLDTETTGLEPGKDEVLSIAIVDIDGNELFHSLIRPLERKRWPKATEIHGITWQDVKDKPTIYDVGDEVAEILENASLIVGYNVEFDMDMLTENGLPSINTECYDLMNEYAQAYGRWSDRKGDYLWCKLEQCARRYKHEFAAHNALEDARATAYCYKKFRDECINELPAATAREAERAKLRAEAAEEKKKLGAETEAKQERDANKKMTIKIIAVIAALASIVVFLNSCSIAGGDILGSFGVMIVSFLAFIISSVFVFI